MGTESTLVKSRDSEPLRGLARAAADSSDSSSSCNPPITGSLPAALLSSVIPTLCAVLRGFDRDFEVGAWPPLFRVAATPFSVVVCESIADKVITEVARLVTEDGARVLRPLRPLLGWEELTLSLLREQALSKEM